MIIAAAGLMALVSTIPSALYLHRRKQLNKEGNDFMKRCNEILDYLRRWDGAPEYCSTYDIYEETRCGSLIETRNALVWLEKEGYIYIHDISEVKVKHYQISPQYLKDGQK